MELHMRLPCPNCSYEASWMAHFFLTLNVMNTLIDNSYGGIIGEQNSDGFCKKILTLIEVSTEIYISVIYKDISKIKR